MLGLLSKFTLSRLKVAWELLSNFHNFQQFLAIALLLPVSAPNSNVHNFTLSQKQLWRNLATANLKFKKQTFLLTVSCSSVFNVEVCLATCLTFRPFLTLDH